MRCDILLVASGLFALASAQSYITPPSCSTSCFQTYLPASGCSSSDVKCLCLNYTFRSNVGVCAYSHCSLSDYNLLVSDSTYNCQLALGVAYTSQATYPDYPAPTDDIYSGGNSNTHKNYSYPKKSGLSAGGRYGLGFGIPALVAAIVGGIFAALKKRKQKAAAASAAAAATAGNSNGVTQIQEQPKMDQPPAYPVQQVQPPTYPVQQVQPPAYPVQPVQPQVQYAYNVPNYGAPDQQYAPAMQTMGPVMQATGPGMQPMAHEMQATGPATQMTTPVMQTTTPVMQTTTPAMQAATPAVQTAGPPAELPSHVA